MLLTLPLLLLIFVASAAPAPTGERNIPERTSQDRVFTQLAPTPSILDDPREPSALGSSFRLEHLKSGDRYFPDFPTSASIQDRPRSRSERMSTDPSSLHAGDRVDTATRSGKGGKSLSRLWSKAFAAKNRKLRKVKEAQRQSSQSQGSSVSSASASSKSNAVPAKSPVRQVPESPFSKSYGLIDFLCKLGPSNPVCSSSKFLHPPSAKRLSGAIARKADLVGISSRKPILSGYSFQDREKPAEIFVPYSWRDGRKFHRDQWR